MFKLVFALTASAAVLAATAPASAANLLGPTAASPMAATVGGVRYRALNTSGSQEEVYLGRNDLGVGANRSAQNLVWTQNGSNTFSFSYKASTDTLTSVVNGGPALNFANFRGGMSPALSALAFNTLQISIRDSAVGAGTIGLGDLKLNGAALTPGGVAGADAAERYWRVYGDFKQDFTLTGKLNLAGGTFASNENNRVQFMLGNTPGVPEPTTWAMMIGGFGLIGASLRRRRSFATA